MKRLKWEYLILGGAVLVLIVLVAFPLFLLFLKSFQFNGHLSLENYIALFRTRRNIAAFGNTLTLGLAASFFAVVLGAPLAWLVTRTDLPSRKLLKTLFILPYMIPPFIGAIAWSQLLNGRNGYVNRILMSVLNLEHSVFNINSMAGLIWVMTLYYYPFVLITTAGALERMDPTLEEAARSSGAGPFRVMRTVTLPLVAPSIAGGALLAFVACIGNFGIPALIGLQSRIYVLTTMISRYMHSGGFGGIKMAAALSGALVLTATAALLINNLVFKKKQYAIIAGKSMRPQVVNLGKWRIPLFAASAVIVIITVIAPFSSIFLTSLLKAWGAKLTLSNLSLENYRYILFEYDLTRAAMKNSLLLAAAAATIAMLLGALIAYISVKTKIRGRKAVDILSALPYSVPGTVIAIAVILAWSGKYGINLYNTFGILVVAYVVHYLSLAVRNTSASLEQIHPSLEEAARVSGSGWLRTFRDVIVPLIKPGLVAGWFLIFMPALRELTMSILLWGPKTPTIGVAVFEMQEAGYVQISAALACLILLFVLAGNGLTKLLTRGKIGM